MRDEGTTPLTSLLPSAALAGAEEFGRVASHAVHCTAQASSPCRQQAWALAAQRMMSGACRPAEAAASHSGFPSETLPSGFSQDLSG